MDFGSASANAAESVVAAEQPIAATRKNERTDIFLTSSLKGKHEAQQLFRCAALPRLTSRSQNSSREQREAAETFSV
jgi:hypothetical protein